MNFSRSCSRARTGPQANLPRIDHDQEENRERPDGVADVARERAEAGAFGRVLLGLGRERGEDEQDGGDQSLSHGDHSESTAERPRNTLNPRFTRAPLPCGRVLQSAICFSTAIMPTTTANSVAPSIMAAVMIIAVEI